ncbi:hypothetical protein AKJ09_02060 [Labilithrix luteola]|uniref:Fibronectin type-III domain-containing protein n=1 Tax=Labilithrix luteola TaxID=1391654 RepID=A0A0K1PPT9_9BACT|nr:hypothetical protein AKJ09_02060 [Labilithrix luteola]
MIVASVLLASLSLSACAADGTSSSTAEQTNEDGKKTSKDGGSTEPAKDDASTRIPESDGGSDSGTDPNPDPDSGTDPGDTTAPAKIADLVVTAESHTSVKLAWTAPGDDGNVGQATAYELRYAKTAITTDADFTAATAVTSGVPTPLAAGSAQTTTISGLDPETTYYFAIRARDAAKNVGALATANVATKARATFVITEIATANATKLDFLELVATKAGWAADLEIKQASGSLYKLGGFEVAQGDILVVHASGTPGPSGWKQEDTAQSKTASTATGASATAFDVYSAQTSITSTDNLLTIVDGTKTLDAVALSERSGTASTAAMTAFAAAMTDGSWNFSAAPVKGTNDCQTQAEAVAVSTASGTTCGKFATGIAAGKSINRKDLVDTNGRADFYIAAETPGAANTPVPAPKLVGSGAPNATQVDLVFDQELAATSVTAAGFVITGASVTAATLTGPNTVSLTTATLPSGVLTIDIAASVTNLQGVPVASGGTICAAATEAKLTVTEINPNLPGGSDLIELQVVEGGKLTGFEVHANPTSPTAGGTLLAKLPGICASAGDIVVVHITPANATGSAPESESSTKTDYPKAAYSANYDNAWDVLGGATGVSNESNVIALRAPSGAYVEAIAFTNGGATTSTAYKNSLTFVQGLGLWTPASCGGAACTDTSTPKASQIGASWKACTTSITGISARRIGTSNDASAWANDLPSTFGAAN